MNRPKDVLSVLSDFRPDPDSKHSPDVQKALFLARWLHERAAALQTASERRRQAELDRMLDAPSDKATLVQMTDQAFRSNNPARAAGHLIHILQSRGIPRFFSPWDRDLLKMFQTFGPLVPGIAMPLAKRHVQRAAAGVILPGEREPLVRCLRRRMREGLRMNVNFLGEAILGEGDAERRLQEYLQALEWPEIEVVSIKISTLYFQISPLARDHTVAALCDRLERLFRAAAQAAFTRPDGKVVHKFVYLDMEEYRDKELTAAAFMRTLDRPGMEQVRAGLALQAYLPDSLPTLLEIQQWARRRVARGGARITIRLVKGANMEMERLEASLKGWPQAPYATKLETDANYQRMLREMMKSENLAAVNVGVASHNLFDLAYGLVLAAGQNAQERVQFEMLEGMANHQARALLELWPNVLLYAPACRKESFVNAIGYLVRRLDENTGPENFLSHAFRLQAGGPEWQRLSIAFLAASDAVPTTADAPRRTQDRREQLSVVSCQMETPATDNRQLPTDNCQLSTANCQLLNEPDTDFSLPHNGQWAAEIVAKWKPRCDCNAPRVPLVVDGQEIFEGPALGQCLDPSRPGVVVGRYCRAGEADVDRAAQCAAADPDRWRSLPTRDRYDLLGAVAQEIRKARADLLGAALANGGKTFAESDPEVSEAVDFLEFYRATARWWHQMPTLAARPKGVVVVVPPWNFPIAIPCGGVAAALAAGNTVILKPSSDAVLVAWELCQCFWRAGVSKRALQLAPCSGAKEARSLVSHPKTSAVILTGGTATALAMLRENPGLDLYAETGGKNATIVTALADRDQAVKHVVHSALSHSGQKCSATSLLLLEGEIYDAPQFRRALCDAAGSIAVGSAWNLETRMGPLIRPPTGDLASALKVLQPGEQWALAPRNLDGNPNLWSPGIKYGVRPGSYTHRTEFFGPVLGVMRFTKLSEAVDLVNQTGYGLTSGLESLDQREWDYWKEHVRAGNLYINRVTTGAVVLRQPFGGFGRSSFGPGMKAGGPNYVAQFMHFEDAVPTGGGCQLSVDSCQSQTSANDNCQLSTDNCQLSTLCDRLAARADELGPDGRDQYARILAAVLSCEQSFREEFGLAHDHFKLLGQDNVRRYLPVGEVRVRVHPEDTAVDLFARVCAAHLVGSRLTVSVPPHLDGPALRLLRELVEKRGLAPSPCEETSAKRHPARCLSPFVHKLGGLTAPWAGAIRFVEETDEQLATAIREHRIDRVRYAAPGRAPRVVLEAAGQAGRCVVSTPVVLEGRLELLWYLREQSLSIDYHRYGNLGARSGQPRTEPR